MNQSGQRICSNILWCSMENTITIEIKHKAFVQQGFKLLLGTLVPFIHTNLSRKFRDKWWTLGIYDKLNDKRGLSPDGTTDFLLNQLDIQRALLIIHLNRRDVFNSLLSKEHFIYIQELMNTRNIFSHENTLGIPPDDISRALDTILRLGEAFDDHSVITQLKALREEFLNDIKIQRSNHSIISDKFSTTSINLPQITVHSPMLKAQLIPWRDVITPRPEVCEGSFKNAEFAANLYLVKNGNAPNEYQDPINFFNRTFFTDGLSNLLIHSIRRITGNNEDPVIKLQTPFGGGKTHSMLALYHLLKGNESLEQLPDIHNILEQSKIEHLPKANIAVIVGSALNPAEALRVNDILGVKQINTVWGEIGR
ncbi:MAG: hypothetical protein LBL38_02075, partial [Lactobacillales bacterium]|nr:hypothetical protein [Lactobacillales bacterium]